MENKVILITGSTSGIGLGLAKSFAAEGAKLILNGLGRMAEVEAEMIELKKLGASEVIYTPADLSNPAEIDKMFVDINAEFNGVDILINNAGIQHVAAIEDFPAAKWELIIKVNLNASFYTIKNVIPYMKYRQWGRIINIASAHALVASPFKCAYVSAKHGLLGLTKTAALELAEFGITVNAICPGYVETPLVINQIADTAKVRHITEEAVVKDVMLALQATKKFVKIEEIASMVKYLSTDSAASVTGTALSIDGGWVAQ